METISDYTIYCTPEQTRKALELGAPLLTVCPNYHGSIVNGTMMMDNDLIYIPTAEQMRGWLEEKGIFIEIKYYSHDRDYGSSIRRISNGNNIRGCLGFVKTRKEATLSAIDAALEYLTNNNK